MMVSKLEQRNVTMETMMMEMVVKEIEPLLRLDLSEIVQHLISQMFVLNEHQVFIRMTQATQQFEFLIEVMA